MSLNRDQLNMVPANPTLNAAYGALTGAQDFPAAIQVMAFAVLFKTTCEQLQLDPSEMLNKAQRVSHTAISNNSLEHAALTTYIQQELNK